MNRKHIARHILWVALLVVWISSHGYKLYGSTNATETVISPPKSAQRIEKYIYKQTPQGELAMYVHFPEDWTTNDKRPAIVFFFGGGWVGGNIKELLPHARYLAKRGMVTARADYRIKSRHGTMPDKCVEDGKSALRWLRVNAAKLGIDPNRITASGVSAGGHVAASTYTTKGLEAQGEETSISSKPNLLVLFEPVLQCAGLVREVGSKEMAVRISPYDNLTKDITPLVVLCGMEDWLVVEAVEFVEKCKKLGIVAELYTAEGQEHGALLKSPWLERAIYLMDKFLARYGYTQGEPTITLPKGKIEMKKILPTSLNVKYTWAYTPLHRAARNGQKELVKVLIANGADVNAKDNWFTPLFYTFRCGDKELVEFLIDNGADVNAKGRWGRTPLYYAAGRGDKELIELFIAKGADVNVKDPTSNTPLHNAVKSRSAGKNIIELLITKGATLNAKNNEGQTPIDVAFQQNRKDIVELLFEKGADVSLHTAAQHGLLEKLKELIGKGTDINAVDSSSMTSLHHAVRRGRKEIVELLLANGADINAKNNEGQTPIDIAAGRNRSEVVKLLILRGADVSIHIAARFGALAKVKSLIEKGTGIDEEDISGQTALHYAVENGHKNVVELLIANGADVNVKNKDGNAPGHVALGKNNSTILELLIAKGANVVSIHLSAYQGDLDKVRSYIEEYTDVNTVDSFGATPLHYATRRGHRQVVEFLIAKGAYVNAKDKRNFTPLHGAAGGGYKDVVALLLDNGANVNARARWDYTPIYYAAWSRSTEVVELLIEKGADVNAKDEWDWTPLHYMAQHDYYRDMAEFLIAKGADVNAEDKWGETPLEVAKEKGHTEIVELLRKQAVNDMVKAGGVNVKDKHGLTPLHHATVKGLNELVKELIVNNAEVDAKDNAGRTPLHYAAGASRGSTNPQAWTTDIVKLILDNGANINARDNLGWTPLHYAAFILNKSIVKLLINRGADLNAVDNRGYTAYSCIRTKASYYESISIYAKTRIDEWHEFIKKYYDIAELIRKNCGIYFVATNGKDSNIGTLEYPLPTITAAVNIVEPGDMIFVRGGSYSCPSTIVIDKSGKLGNPIFLRAYPGENPILDFSGTKGDSIFITGAYWHLKGLTITKGFRGAIGIYGNGAHHNIFEQITAFDNRYAGIRIEAGAANNIILNSDSYRNFDLEWNGEDSDGFGAYWDIGEGNVFIGNRAWNNSDDGYDLWDAGNSVRIEKCYAWRNGENIWNHPFFSGNANGFKLGRGGGRHVLISCLAWGHNLTGFNLNNNTDGVILRNCTAWSNELNYAFNWSNSEKAKEDCVFINNISYNGNKKNGMNPRADSQCNSWDADLGLTLTDDDFLSLDDSAIIQPRNPDGSIPQNDFLKLVPQSAAIDKGSDIDMPFAGERPDLGAFEYDSNENTQNYVKMLHQYIRDHDMEKINETLATGIDVNEKDWLGYAPLHWACYFGYLDVAGLLLDNVADSNLKSDTGRTPLEIAAMMEYTKIVDLLRKHAAKE
jgi:ankyrin repeat protein/acetyl esterase/lipase